MCWSHLNLNNDTPVTICEDEIFISFKIAQLFLIVKQMKLQTNQEEPCVQQKGSLRLHPYRRHQVVKGISLVDKYEKNNHFVWLHPLTFSDFKFMDN